MDLLFSSYKPLLEAATEQDLVDLAGTTPLDYQGEWVRLHKEFSRKFVEIRRKYGILSDGSRK